MSTYIARANLFLNYIFQAENCASLCGGGFTSGVAQAGLGTAQVGATLNLYFWHGIDFLLDRRKLEAYAEPGDVTEGNQAVYGKVPARSTQDGGATDLERSGSDGQNEEHVYDDVPPADQSSGMSDVALDSSSSFQNDNYETIE